MFKFFLLYFIQTGCSSKLMDTAENNDNSEPEDANNSSHDCAYPLVELQTSQDETCSGGNIHRWPIGMEPTDCHGWGALDNRGQEHSNSASEITCHSDGSFSFKQYPGNLECSGTGVLKTYYPNECEQDIPPVLYTVAIDLTCCSTPEACATEIPSVSIEGSTIYKNGELCQ
jgi:hypothetical protein